MYAMGFTIALSLTHAWFQTIWRDIKDDEELLDLVDENKHIFKSPMTSWKMLEKIEEQETTKAL